MQRTHIRRLLLAAAAAVASASCGASTSPSLHALDGPWTSGHACLSLGFNLSWTGNEVDGSGNYRTDVGPVTCAPAPAALLDFGSVVMTAIRPSATAITGTMTFDGATRAKFTGTLVRNSGGARIDGTVTMPDGGAAAFTVFEGLIP